MIVFITTVPITAKLFLSNQFKMLIEKGNAVGLITSEGKEILELRAIEGLLVHVIPVEREISLFLDIQSLFKLFFLLRKLQPTVVHASTPKAGLLGMVAAFLARVPIRLFQQRGLRLETTNGVKRKVLLATEKITNACAHHIVCNSFSLMEKLKDLGLTSADKYLVVGQGSSRGVDTERYSPASDQEKVALRKKYGIVPNDLVIGFVGRLTKDKGVSDLISAFEQINRRFNNVSLVLVGGYEEGDPIPASVEQIIARRKNIYQLGFVKDTSETYNLMDVFAFPSYREGFPNAPLEASASGLPIVGYKVTGTIDAVIDGETGFLVKAKDSVKFAEALCNLLESEVLRRQTGETGRKRCVQEFDRQIIDKNWVSFYEQFL